ncbi:MAG: aldo/keto reductase [Acidobacteria bacterium]|nr:aldo/keto reductase [Acidobacteriota bacterium]MBS1865821.1 aldo/keto reductase [Acidobacteriota bacterium]
MQTKKLGNSDLQITRIGFGAWAAGGPGWEFAWGTQDDADSIAAIHRALEHGINWIDTAAVYGLGHSEEVVARALQTWPGAEPYVFTKCSLRWDADGKINSSHSAASVREECEDSLRRLQIDVIDLYQMHWPPRDNGPQLEEAWQTMAALQKEGKVRWIGVSNFDPAQMRRAQAIAPVTSNQPPYSILRRAIEAENLPFCLEQGIGTISYAPMASGLLTGSMNRERAAALPPGDFRSRNPEFREPKLSKNIELVDRMKNVGARHGRGPGEVAIAWVLKNEAITGAIVGSRSAKQIDGIIGAADLALTPQDISEIEGAAAAVAR